MSKSFKKVSITGNVGCVSEKKDKSIASRKERRKVKETLYSIEDFDTYLDPDKKTLYNVYDMGKDGKHYFDPNLYPKDMRK